jgi:hypothetical protein
MKQIRFLGRFSLILLLVIGMEGLATLGMALNYQSYGPLAWICQSLVLMLCIWGAAEFQVMDKN